MARRYRNKRNKSSPRGSEQSAPSSSQSFENALSYQDPDMIKYSTRATAVSQDYATGQRIYKLYKRSPESIKQHRYDSHWQNHFKIPMSELRGYERRWRGTTMVEVSERCFLYHLDAARASSIDMAQVDIDVWPAFAFSREEERKLKLPFIRSFIISDVRRFGRYKGQEFRPFVLPVLFHKLGDFSSYDCPDSPIGFNVAEPDSISNSSLDGSSILSNPANLSIKERGLSSSPASGDLRRLVDVKVRIQGKWAPISVFLQRFVIPLELDQIPQEVDNYHLFASSHARKPGLMTLPPEIRNIIFSHLMPEELFFNPTAFGTHHPIIRQHPNSYNEPFGFVDQLEESYVAIPRCIDFADEANTYLFRFRKFVATTAEELDNLFAPNLLPINYLHAIRHIEIHPEKSIHLLWIFGAKMQRRNWSEFLPSWSSPFIRALDIDTLRVHFPRSLFKEYRVGGCLHKERPCRTTFVNHLLQSMFPFIYHIPNIEFSGYIKLAQITNFRRYCQEAKSMGSIHRQLLSSEYHDKVWRTTSELSEEPEKNPRTIGKKRLWSYKELKDTFNMETYYIHDGQITIRDPRLGIDPPLSFDHPPCQCGTPCHEEFFCQYDDAVTAEEWEKWTVEHQS